MGKAKEKKDIKLIEFHFRNLIRVENLKTTYELPQRKLRV